MTKQQREQITKHGENLLALFPKATEKDPVELCKKLRRIEVKANRYACDLCNGTIQPTEKQQERTENTIMLRVQHLLGDSDIPVFINLDPRGYALKIRDEWMREHNDPLYRDWGGYGILAPEF